MRIGVLLGLLVVFAVALLYSAAQPSEGQKIYMDKCASCHAKDGMGNTARGRTLKVPDLSSTEIQKKTDEQLIQGMTSVKGHTSYRKQLGEDGLRKLVLFLRALKAPAKGKE
jgi:cytochrome c